MAFDDLDWSNTAVIAHHAQFDGLILSHHFGIKPAFWFDTLSMARMVHGNHLSVALGSLAKHYDLDAKSVPYDLFRGRHWADLDEPTRQALAAGCIHDVELTWQIFEKLIKVFPQEELPIVDATIRMFTEPCLVGDRALFADLRDKEMQSKNEMLYALGVGEKDLQSADKFKTILEGIGVEVEMKTAPPSKNFPEGREIPALAKTDQFMRNLLEDDDETVCALAQARLDVRSTLAETRAGRLHDMSARGALCVYLSAYGAHTTRWSGGDKVNFQNLPRSGGLRHGVAAPEGHSFGAVDQSQGECRVLNWLAGQDDVVERFRAGHDPYLPMASTFYGREITKVDKEERGLGKVLELQCGFGSGGAKIKSKCRSAGIIITDAEGTRGRDAYRSTHSQVVALWRQAETTLHLLADGRSEQWEPLAIRDGKIYLPNGAWLDFTSLHWHVDPETGERYWRLKTRYGFTKYYGAKLVENVVQALSRVITSQAMLRLRAQGYRIVGMAHDDLWVLIPKDGRQEAHAAVLRDAMRAIPAWGPDLPLDAEVKIGATYG